MMGCSGMKQAETKASVLSKEVMETSISSNLSYLASDALMGRQTGSAGIEKAAVFIESHFREQGVKPYFQSYRDSFQVKDQVGYNIVGVLEGTDPQLKQEYIVIGAHYDHVGVKASQAEDNIYNGANDNASGTAAVMELAKYFSDKKLKRSLLFTLFSAEEMGLVGAKQLAARFKKENTKIQLVLNVEMVGVPMENKTYSAYLTGYHHSDLAQDFNAYAGGEVLGYLPQAAQYNLFKRSDNYPFYQELAIPAHTISTFDFTNYSHYHGEEDEFELMDVTHMADLVREMIPGIRGIANTEDGDIKLLKE